MPNRWMTWSLCLVSAGALACPPGTVLQQGIGWQGCAPIVGTEPSSQSRSASREVWEDRWGAIALDDANIAAGIGSASGMRRRATAEKSALTDCKQKGIERCKVKFTYHSQCAVIVWGDQNSNITGAPSIEQATEIGMKKCEEAKDTNCETLFSECSYPERTQ